MKSVTLKRLELTNYRNIEHAVYEFDGNSKIVGENRIGKTNTLESIYFLLGDCLLGGNNDISAIKPLTDTKKIVKVEGTFDIDGTEITIGKEYGEDWVKERNTTNLVMKGHFTTYYINGLKQSTLKAFKQTFNEYFGITEDVTVKINFVRLLIDPFYLGDLGDSVDWTNLRSFIIKLVGDVKDEDVFNQAPNTRVIQQDIEQALGKLDVVKKKYKSDIDGANEKLLQDDAKIDMLQKTEKPTDEQVAIARKGVEEGNDTISALRSQTGNATATLNIKNKINDIDTRINELKAKELAERENSPSVLKVKENKTKIDALYGKVNEAISRKSEINSKISNLEYLFSSKNREVDSLTSERASLVETYKDLKLKLANPNSYITTECPTCHRPLDADKVEEARARFVADCNEKIAKINTRGGEIKTKLATVKDEMIKLVDDKNKANEMLGSVETEIASYRKEIDSLNETPVQEEFVSPFASEIENLNKEKESLNNELREMNLDAQNKLQAINQQIYDKQEEIKVFQRTLDDLAYYDRQMVELNKVEQEKSQHSENLIDAEQKRDLLNTFIYTKLKMLDENVSKVFGNIKFQLIKENINGGFDPVCKPYIYNVDKEESTTVLWKSGSKSERVITGIAIAEAIKMHLGLSNLPYIFDEGGEISSDTFSSKFKTNSQLICVKVEDGLMNPVVMKIN